MRPSTTASHRSTKPWASSPPERQRPSRLRTTVSELTWHNVGAAEERSVGFLRRVEVEGSAVCLGRTAQGWVAFQDTCTHEECSLADGELEGNVVVCPCHASEFDLRTGDVLSPPALDPLPIFEVRTQAGELQVRLAPPPEAAEAV